MICASRLLNTVAHAKLTRLAYFFILYSIFSFLFSVRTYVCSSFVHFSFFLYLSSSLTLKRQITSPRCCTFWCNQLNQNAPKFWTSRMKFLRFQRLQKVSFNFASILVKYVHAGWCQLLMQMRKVNRENSYCGCTWIIIFCFLRLVSGQMVACEVEELSVGMKVCKL